MKSLNIVFCALSFITLPLVAMELQKETKKRAAEEIEEEKPAKVQAIESEQEQEIGKALEKEHARIAQEEKIEQEWQKKSAFERLPLELKAHILTFLKTAPGNTKEARLQAAAQNIRNFMVLNKEFNTFLNDIPTNEYLINELAKNYIARNPNQISYSEGIKAALVLQTTGAGRFLLQYAYSDKNEITDFGKAIAVQLFQAADENNLPRVEFILRNIPRIITAVDLNESISNDYESFTLLQRATQQGNEPLVKIALNALKRVNEMRSALASAPDGTTLLSLAAYSGNVAIFDLIKNYVIFNA